MKLFKKEKEINQTTKKPIPENHKSSKKKNTYSIVFSPFYDAEVFCLCKNTPLGVEKINGTKLTNTSGWISCHEFPNPYAQEFAKHQDTFTEIMGSKIATTIIEYLDKETGKPVAQIYPHIVYIFDGYEQDFMSHLNHASRRDMERQINLRKMLASDFYSKRQK